jgi:septum formation protein
MFPLLPQPPMTNPGRSLRGEGSASHPFILGSRSPRRRELLAHLIPEERIRIVPPHEADEPGFDNLHTDREIVEQLQRIARMKNEDVVGQLAPGTWTGVLTADTTIVASHRDGRPVALGKPDGEGWEERVRSWFLKYYSGRTHRVITAVCVTSPIACHGSVSRAEFGPSTRLAEPCHAEGEGSDARQEFYVTTEVNLEEISDELLDWYLATGEPLGKAGGYGLQGAGGMFATLVTGSISNVIGLPLKETWQALKRMNLLAVP